MQTRKRIINGGGWIGFICAAIALLAQPLHGATKYWDINGVTAGAGGTTPTGNWTGTSFWTTDSTGASATTTFTSGTDAAVFSAGSDATGSFTVTLGSVQTATSLLVEEGTVTKSGSALTVQNITINSGATLLYNSSGGLVASAGATLTLNGTGATFGYTAGGVGGTFLTSNMGIVLNGGGTLSDQLGNPNIYSGVISGTGDLVKTGPGVLSITTTCTYSGNTRVNNGVLRLRTGTPQIPNTDLIVTSPGGFDCAAFNQTIQSLSGTGNLPTSGSGTLTIAGTASTVFSGVWSGSGRINVSKLGGTGTLTIDGVNTASGRFTLTDGTVTVNSGKALCGPVCDLFVNGGVLNFNNTAQTIENLSGTGGTINLTAGLALISDPIASTTCSSAIAGAGGLTKLNANATTRTLTLNGANSYDGVTTVTKGIISVGSATALGTTVGNTVVEGTGPGEILFTGATTTFTCAEPFNIAGVGASDGGAIAIIASAAPTLSGTITLSSDATVTVSSSASGTFTGSPAFSGTTQTLTLAGGNNPTGTKLITGGITLGTGGVTKTQGGTWNLSGANTYTGPTLISAGRLNVNSPGSLAAGSTVTVSSGAVLGGTGEIGGPTTIQSGGTLSPGTSIGTLTFSSSLTLSGNTSNEINKAAGPLLTSDKIVMTSGTVTLGGTLVVTATGLPLALGDTFDLIDGNISGTFDAFNLPTLSAGLAWDTSKLATGQDGTLSVVCDASLTASVVVDQNATCNGNSDGKATVSFSGGGGGPYEVRLDAGSFSAQSSPHQFTGLTLGSHTITVKDVNGCTFTTAPFDITQPAVLVASAGTNRTICVASSTTIGGFSTASGGTPGYSYLWSNADSLDNPALPNPVASPSSNTTYTVTVTDANGCTATSSVTVTLNPTVATGGNQTICAGSSTVGLGGIVGGTATGGYWTSSGTGTFSPDTNALNAIYTPSPLDVANGSVTLTLTTTGQDSPCGPAAAQMLVSITTCEPGLQACWRGQGGSTFQAWTFASSNSPTALPPDLSTNSFGGAVGAFNFGAFSDGYVDSDPFLGGQQGLWDMGRSGSLTLDITNTTSGSGASYKYVNVVVTEFRDGIYNQRADVNVPGGTLLHQVQQSTTTNSFGGQWISSRTIWRLGSPCPGYESVVITSGTNGTLLDEVVVETMCVDLTCLPDVFVSADPGMCSKSNMTWTAPSIDGCLITNIVFTPPLGSTFTKGTNSVTMEVTDKEGATQSCNFNVVVTDDEPPTVGCPADIVAARLPGQCGAVVNFAPTALDNCPGATAACVPPSGSFFPLGLTTVTCTATDAVGNVSAPCTFTVRVDDYTGDVTSFQPCWRGVVGSTYQSWTFATSNNPAILFPNLQTNVYGSVSATLSFGTFSDGYIDSDIFLGCRQGIWDLGGTGVLTLSITNTSSGSGGSYKYVQVVATQFRDSLYNENATVSIAGGVQVNQSQEVVGTNSFGGEWVAVKALWRLASPCPASESIVITAGTNGTLLDQVLVETMCMDVTCPLDILATTDPGSCDKTNVVWSLPLVDGCLVTNVSCVPPSGSTFAKGTNLVTVVVTDGEGGTKNCNFNVVILDNELPVVSCPANIVAVRNPAVCGAVVTFSAMATDNCPGVTVGSVPASGSVFPLGLTTVTCTATDAVGNVSLPCTFTVRVDDFTGDVAAFQPCWRGQAGSTFQSWTFAESNNPVALPPTLATNAYGSVAAGINFGTFSDGYIESDPFLGCRQGIWDLGHTGMMTLSITNTSGGSGGSYKYVQVVVTQFRDTLYNENATVGIAGGIQVGQVQQVVGTNNSGGEWIAAKTLWRLGSPCPASESIEITAGTNGTLVDQVLVETLCIDLVCPTDILTSADPGSCSKSNITWALPAVDGCVVTNIVCSPTNGSTFPVGTNLVTCTIMDGEGGTKVCNLTVTVLDVTVPVITATTASEAQPSLGNVNVKDCANVTMQGAVNISITVNDECGSLPPLVTLTNGAASATATFVNQSPLGTYNYSWLVTAGTSNGTWTVTATASDPSGNLATAGFTLCVNKAQITGSVELEQFVGTGPGVNHSRVVTFVATTNTTVLKTWTLTLTNVSGPVFSYLLTDVPLNLNGISAKTAWNLREKLAVSLDVNGQAAANFVSDGVPGWSAATDHYLRGGDITGNNIVNLGDYNLLLSNFLLPYAPADINGSGVANLAEYNLIQINWLELGDPQ